MMAQVTSDRYVVEFRLDDGSWARGRMSWSDPPARGDRVLEILQRYWKVTGDDIRLVRVVTTEEVVPLG